jgi:hypothetical protein
MGKDNLGHSAEGDFWPKKEQVTGRRKKLLLDDIQAVYSSPNVTQMIKKGA